MNEIAADVQDQMHREDFDVAYPNLMWSFASSNFQQSPDDRHMHVSLFFPLQNDNIPTISDIMGEDNTPMQIAGTLEYAGSARAISCLRPTVTSPNPSMGTCPGASRSGSNGNAAVPPQPKSASLMAMATGTGTAQGRNTAADRPSKLKQVLKAGRVNDPPLNSV